MSFHEDAAIITGVMRGRDPSFRRVPDGHLERAVDALHMAANQEDKDVFLFAAMAAVALANNAHSRVIPNAAVSTVPHRIVYRDGTPAIVRDGAIRPIIAVNDKTPAQLLKGWSEVLPGPQSRKRALSGLMLAWPSALHFAGVVGATIRYQLQGGEVVGCPDHRHVPAASLFPSSENGFLNPVQDTYALNGDSLVCWQGAIWRVRLASLLNLEENDVLRLVHTLDARADCGVLIDLRGNTGGSFLKAMPLVDWLAETWKGKRCAILVNEYTFSAAIVAAVLLKHRLGHRACLIGSEMGDTLKFYAEGGTELLPQSGAHLRYATAWHDWATGAPDDTTPEIVAKHMVGIGKPDILAVAQAFQMQAALAFAQGD